MIIIETVSDRYFKINGVQQPKIYQPLKQGNSAISLFQVFNNFKLTSSTSFDEYSVDGFVYGTQELTIAALLPVIYLEDATFDFRTYNYEGDLIEQTITNNPDNEDLAVSGSVLRFKDRTIDVNGRKGYRIIRQDFNWSDIPDDYANCIWEIRYAKGLGGITVSIPEGVTLKFNGGILGGANIVGNNTEIIAPAHRLFLTDIFLSGTWKTKDFLPQWYNAKGDGITDDTVAVQKSLDNSKRVVFPEGNYLISSVTASDNIIEGNGVATVINASDNETVFQISNTTIRGMKSDATNGYCLYFITAGNNCKVIDNVFDGDYGHCIRTVDADNVDIIGNVLEEGVYSQTIPIVAINSSDIMIANNFLKEHTGFGIQARFSRNISMIGNRVNQRVFSETFSTTSTTETFTLTPDRSVSRYALYNNGQFIEPSVVKISDNEYEYTASGLTIGQDTTIYGFVGLEQLQVNAGCDGVVIDGNVLSNSGDSNIVIGCDYHFNGSVWVLDPALKTRDDYPRNVVVTSNYANGITHASGIALNEVLNCVVADNIIRDVGFIELAAFQNGINIGSVCEEVICSDNITENKLGFTKACVTSLGNVNYPHTLSNNIGVACKNYNFYPDTDVTKRRNGYRILNASENDLLTRRIEAILDSGYSSGAYSDNYFTIAISGGTGISATTTAYGAYRGFRTHAGEYANFTPSANVRNLFKDKLWSVEFWAKADSGSDSGNFRSYYDPSTDDPEPTQQILISGTEWKKYGHTIAIGSLDNIFFRITGTTGIIYISQLKITALDVE